MGVFPTLPPPSGTTVCVEAEFGLDDDDSDDDDAVGLVVTLSVLMRPPRRSIEDDELALSATSPPLPSTSSVLVKEEKDLLSHVRSNCVDEPSGRGGGGEEGRRRVKERFLRVLGDSLSDEDIDD